MNREIGSSEVQTNNAFVFSEMKGITLCLVIEFDVQMHQNRRGAKTFEYGSNYYYLKMQLEET